ncbi:MAG: hypothetical protein HY784_16100 [Chloroflexi bacterium]|nr:hypothetical protein [Chloroflexota bacterium]
MNLSTPSAPGCKYSTGIAHSGLPSPASRITALWPSATPTHYYNRIGVAVLALTGTIRVGDAIQIIGRSSDFEQRVVSLQIEHQAVSEAGPGADVALRVNQRVRPHDGVFRVGRE